jgi:hypothetical protein
MAALIGVVAKGGGYTAKIPLDLLAQDGVPPEQGDDVSFSVDATVKSVDADDATVSITSVNGEPVSGSGADDESTEPDEDEATPAPGGSTGGPPQPGGQAGGASGAGGKGWPVKAAVVAPVRPVGPISPQTAAIGAALRKRAKGQPMPF